MSHYTWHSLSPSARVITIYMFRTLSYVTETLMFIYAGFDMWTTTLWNNETYAKVCLCLVSYIPLKHQLPIDFQGGYKFLQFWPLLIWEHVNLLTSHIYILTFIIWNKDILAALLYLSEIRQVWLY